MEYCESVKELKRTKYRTEIYIAVGAYLLI